MTTPIDRADATAPKTDTSTVNDGDSHAGADALPNAGHESEGNADSNGDITDSSSEGSCAYSTWDTDDNDDGYETDIEAPTLEYDGTETLRAVERIFTQAGATPEQVIAIVNIGE